MTGELCAYCNESMLHYMFHICLNCECIVHECRIPGEPQIGTYYELEPVPYCPVHGGTP